MSPPSLKRISLLFCSCLLLACGNSGASPDAGARPADAIPGFVGDLAAPTGSDTAVPIDVPAGTEVARTEDGPPPDGSRDLARDKNPDLVSYGDEEDLCAPRDLTTCQGDGKCRLTYGTPAIQLCTPNPPSHYLGCIPASATCPEVLFGTWAPPGGYSYRIIPNNCPPSGWQRDPNYPSPCAPPSPPDTGGPGPG
jgi:hypothetical protein